jgi:hypothetical protein
MERDVFEILMENAVNERLDDILLENEEYSQIQAKVCSMSGRLDDFGFSKEQRSFIDDLMCANTESGCCYGKATYRQGFRDCAALLWEMGLIK